VSVEDAVNDDRAVTELVRLARRTLQGEAPRREPASFQRLEARLAERSKKVAWPWIFAPGLAVVAAVAVAVSWFLLRSPALTYEVAHGLEDRDGLVRGSGPDTRIRFSDGSEVTLAPGSETRVAELDPRGGRVQVNKGEVHVSIARKPGANWRVEAGPYTIRVTGTAFEVRWHEAEQRFELEMDHGSVVVTGPHTGPGIALRAGQRMIGKQGKVTVDDARTTASAKEPERSVSEPARQDSGAQDPEATLAVRPSTGKADTRGASWSQLVAQGDFASVIQDAEKRGLERVFSTASLADLSALADAARYARRGTIAQRALLAERQRFPGSRQARDAAFFLGRLKEDEGGGALEWYERYLSESPQGTYVSQALGRKVMLVYQQRGAAAARSEARAYLERYPNGPYAAAARKIVAETDPHGTTRLAP
jgi:ferric-dicitrate binding protein FerR (iron transport regulator)